MFIPINNEKASFGRGIFWPVVIAGSVVWTILLVAFSLTGLTLPVVQLALEIVIFAGLFYGEIQYFLLIIGIVFAFFFFNAGIFLFNLLGKKINSSRFR